MNKKGIAQFALFAWFVGIILAVLFFSGIITGEAVSNALKSPFIVVIIVLLILVIIIKAGGKR